MKKRIQSLMLIVTLLLGLLVPATNVSAETNRELLEKRGLKPIVAIEIDEEDLEGDIVAKNVAISNVDRAYWTQFSSTYYYDYFLNDAEKAFWDGMENLSLAMATGTLDYSSEPEMQQWVGCDSSITKDRMIDLMFLFIYSNPQYYFISNQIYYIERGTYKGGFLMPYDEFLDGDARKGVSDEFCSKIDVWATDVKLQEKQEEKVKRAHDIICQNTVYNYNAFDQTAYSMVCMGETVCAGYAKTMQILCNAAGVECLMVTGDNHAWNVVQVHGIWYELDATWDDQSWGTIYNYYNKSRTTFHAAGGHTEEPPYCDMLVDAPYDMFESGQYVSPYFTVDNVTYYVVNGNANLAGLLVKPVGGATGVPATVTYNGNVYTVLGATGLSGKGDVAQLGAFVERMYTVALGRENDPEGHAFWTDILLTGKADGAGLAQGFILGPEFAGKNYSNEEYITILYRTFFNREAVADPEGYAFWLSVLNAGNTKENVLAGFVNSAEFDSLCKTYGIFRGIMREDGTAINPGIGQFAERLYTKILERNSEMDGLYYWSMQMANGACTPVEAARNFLYGPEYLSKKTTNVQYIEILYRTFMGREADAEGIAFWLHSLKNGTSRDEALNGFATSPEFQQIMQSYGL